MQYVKHVECRTLRNIVLYDFAHCLQNLNFEKEQRKLGTFCFFLEIIKLMMDIKVILKMKD